MCFRPGCRGYLYLLAYDEVMELVSDKVLNQVLSVYLMSYEEILELVSVLFLERALSEHLLAWGSRAFYKCY